MTTLFPTGLGMRAKDKKSIAKWTIKLLTVFLKAVAVRLLGIVFFNRNNLSMLLKKQTMLDILKFAIGATSIPGLFILTRSLMQLIQNMLKIKIETFELLISGAVASLGTMLFTKSYMNAVKTIAYMRAVQCVLISIKNKFAHLITYEGKEEMTENQYSIAA